MHLCHRGTLGRPVLGVLNSSVSPSPASTSASPHSPTPVSAGPASASTQSPPTPFSSRVQRLDSLVQIRRLYRNLVRADVLLRRDSPVYSPPPPPGPSASDDADASAQEDAREDALSDAIKQALRVLSDMDLTASQLEREYYSLSPDYGATLTFPPPARGDAKAVIEERVFSLRDALHARILTELPTLPSDLDPDTRRQVADMAAAAGDGASLPPPPGEDGPSGGSALVSRLDKAERSVERFVAQRVGPAVRKAREDGAANVLKGLATYSRGLWDRLNGGGGVERGEVTVPPGLPLPTGTRTECVKETEKLIMDADRVERELQTLSKLREEKLQRAGIQGRTELAFILPNLDKQVLDLSRNLAIGTLQLQMFNIYMALEDEAIDILDAGSAAASGSPSPIRSGSSQELGVYVAEFSLLDSQLEALAQMQRSGSGASGGGVFDDGLSKLAVEIPDLRDRLGITEQEVYAQAEGLQRAQLQIRGSIVGTKEKIIQGLLFFRRGFNLLSSDIVNASQLFTKAALGSRLRRREVMALRRTAKDIFVIVPFTVILILPMTPVGHVLVFSFIQRYFPNAFPSQFTGKRQEIMTRYDELRMQLVQARMLAEEEDDQMELARAAQCVQSLTAPTRRSEPSTEGSDPPAARPALAQVEDLEAKTKLALQNAVEGDLDDD